MSRWFRLFRWASMTINKDGGWVKRTCSASPRPVPPPGGMQRILERCIKAFKIINSLTSVKAVGFYEVAAVYASGRHGLRLQRNSYRLKLKAGLFMNEVTPQWNRFTGSAVRCTSMWTFARTLDLGWIIVLLGVSTWINVDVTFPTRFAYGYV